MGLDGFAVTDHDTVKGVPEVLKKGGELTIIPGLEVSARGAHILALDAREPISAGLSLAETVEKIRDQGAISVIAHPHSLIRSPPTDRELIDSKIEAVEAANSSHIPFDWLLRKNEALAKRLKLPVTGGSDAHIPEVVGRAFTIVETDSNEIDDVITSIRSGRTEASGKGITLMEKMRKFML